MALLRLGALAVDADLVVFDKDGTLIDFHGVWGARARQAVAALGAAPALARLAPGWRERLYFALGFDPASGRVDGAGVLACEPHAVIERHCLETLAASGVPAAVAARAVHEHFAPVMRALPAGDAVVPLDGAAALFAALARAGVHCAVLTTDDRAATEIALRRLDVTRQVAALVCGDDAIAPKPAPDGILHLAARLGVAPARTVMVGDTPLDLRAGRAAGCACVAGVTSGACEAGRLAPLADVVLDSIRDIRVAD